MDNKEKNTTLIIVIIAIILMIGCVLSICCAAGVFFLLRDDSSSLVNNLVEKEDAFIEKIDPSATDNPSEPSEPAETETVAPSDENTDSLTAGQLKIIERCEKIRGLSSSEKMAPIYQTQDELRAYLTDELYAGVTEDEFNDEHDLYTILGFTPEDFDLEQFYLDLYTEQIAGFYDQDTNKMYLIKGGSEIENSLTLAHEYTHFLQFNTPEFAKTLKYDDSYCDEEGEMCVILEAITEGDATLTEYLLQAEKDLNLNQNDTSNETEDSSIFDSAPKFFQDSMLFPYQYGFDFVSNQYMKGGFKSVNQLYLDPPASVEQIIHPEKYQKDEPTDVNIEPFVNLIGQNSELGYGNVLNEADLTWLFGSAYKEEWRLSEQQASSAAAGWDGGSFQFARCDGKSLFFSKTVWDTKKDAQEAYQAYSQYSKLRFGDPQEGGYWVDEDGFRVDLIQQDDIVFWMITPDTFDAQPLLDLINGGSAL